jgi:bifunctional non-homologous end joining protein LigD
MVAFDLLYLNGYDLRKLPLIERKAHLKKLIAKTPIQFSESFEVDGREMYQHACSVGLEGVVSKVRESRYASSRGNDWAKVTCRQRETLPIAGFALDGSKWDGIHVGRLKGKRSCVCRQSRSRLRQDVGGRVAKATEAFDPQNAALCEENRAPRHLG